ncbi:MAG: hypothetical protein KBF48_14205 [Xanthomonadales bacterium]|jgi:chorismate mutase|nr:hypothetical protein [Thermoflexales bacterium]MBP9156088.1 hypothetical protein [Xanthomonadales bacterium]
MALKQLIAAASALESARQRIDELKGERAKINARLDEIVAELAAARADAGQAIATIQAEASTAAAP